MKLFSFFLLSSIGAGMYAQSFTKIVSGPMVNTSGDSRSVNWVDVNNDGFLDCMITNGPNGGQNNTLFLNNGSGGFNALTGDSIVLDNKPSDGATWADSDNDGDEDCVVVNWYGLNNLFYKNNGNGTFTKINSGTLVTDGGYSETASWGDYDNDGLVDLYVTNSAGTLQNFLYKNMGISGFLKVVGGDVVTDAFQSRSVNWTDMDLDGDLDLFVTNEGGQNENIYRNDGNGVFNRIFTGALVNGGGNTISSSWGDYDNDGDLDVFLANNLSNNALFRNDGNFDFTKITTDTVSKDFGRSFSSAWSDVDNDGDLDLYVTNAFGPQIKRTCFFYLNNGNGSFSRISNNPIVLDSAWTYGCAFGDYDNDGFDDLAVATCRFAAVDQPDFLYHNNGNANNWVTIKLQGVISNRSAIGAKIRAKAVINGTPVWQMREISAQNGYCSQNDVRAHFGISNATKVDSIIIEWPSGILQYLINVSPNQFLTIVEDVTLNRVAHHKSDEIRFRVFPNPVTGQLTIDGGYNFSAGDKISITDMAGKLVMMEEVNQTTARYTIDLKKYALTHGAYNLSLHTNKGSVVTQKILIDK